MRSYIGSDGLAAIASTIFVVVAFLWAFGCGALAPQCELTVTYIERHSGTGTVEPNGGTFPCGTTVTLTAIPDIGCWFVGWEGDLTGGANPATLLMDTDKTVTPLFDP